MDRLSYWGNSQCNDLKGNDGSKFPSPVAVSATLFLFLVADFCAAIPFTFHSSCFSSYSSSSVGTVTTMRFAFDDTTRMNCLQPTGVVSVAACHAGAPVSTTFLADERQREARDPRFAWQSVAARVLH